MTNLKSRILKAVEFDENRARQEMIDNEEFLIHDPPPIPQNVFVAGTCYENSRLQPLIEALSECAEVLKRAADLGYFEPGGSNHTMGSDALAELEAALEGKDE